MIDYEKILECYILYVECHMSFREVAENLCLKSHNTVKKRLDKLKDVNVEMYDIYQKEKKGRRGSVGL